MRVLNLFLIFCFFCRIAVAEEIKEQEKLQEIYQELKESKEKLWQTKKKQQEVLGKLAKINLELRSANRKISKAKEKMQLNTLKIKELVLSLQEKESDLQRKSGILQKHLVEAYKNNRLNYLDLLFNSESMSDFLNRMYFFEKIVAQDANLIREVRGDLQETKKKKETLSDHNREIKELLQVISEEKNKIAQQAEEKKKIFDELKERQKEFERKIAELERSSRELEVLIQKKVAARMTKVRGTGTLIWPLQGRITSRFGAIRRWGGGYRHTGIDIAAPYGSPVVAADAGEVIFAGWWDGYGKAIVVDHGNKRSTVYAHLSRIYVKVGEAVMRGQTIGLEGSTGYSTGPHLHFEVRINGVPVNPINYLP